MVRNSFPSKSEKSKQILKFLSVRARSEKEIRDRLSKYGLNPEEIQIEIEKLKKWKLVDDADFAQTYIESRSRSRPRSRRLLELELRRKGVTISDNGMTMNDYELAQSALEKKKNLKSREQAIRFLQYRGFAWETIVKALKDKYNDSDDRFGSG